MKAATDVQDPTEGFSLKEAAWDQVHVWSEICQKFLTWQNREILKACDPSAEKLEQHRSGLKWLLRFGRALYLAAADPDYPDKRVSRELRGRLVQLEHSWRMVHEPMPQAEAEKLLAELFPG
jgi:hypothetical protein